MSKIFVKLKELQQQRSVELAHPKMSPRPAEIAAETPVIPVIPDPVIPAAPLEPEISVTPVATEVPAIEKRPMPMILIIGMIVMLGVAFFLGTNIASVKSSNMNINLQEQQSQIAILSKKLTALQVSVDNRIKKTENKSNDLNKSVQDKIDDLNNGVASKLDQTSANMNRIEAILQSNIDELNTKVNKLSAPNSSKTGN